MSLTIMAAVRIPEAAIDYQNGNPSSLEHLVSSKIR